MTVDMETGLETETRIALLNAIKTQAELAVSDHGDQPQGHAEAASGFASALSSLIMSGVCG